MTAPIPLLFCSTLMLKTELRGMNSSKDPNLPIFKQWFPLVALLEYCALRMWGSKKSCDLLKRIAMKHTVLSYFQIVLGDLPRSPTSFLPILSQVQVSEFIKKE